MGGTRPVAWGQTADAFGARASVQSSYGLYEAAGSCPLLFESSLPILPGTQLKVLLLTSLLWTTHFVVYLV